MTNDPNDPFGIGSFIADFKRRNDAADRLSPRGLAPNGVAGTEMQASGIIPVPRGTFYGGARPAPVVRRETVLASTPFPKLAEVDLPPLPAPSAPQQNFQFVLRPVGPLTNPSEYINAGYVTGQGTFMGVATPPTVAYDANGIVQYVVAFTPTFSVNTGDTYFGNLTLQYNINTSQWSLYVVCADETQADFEILFANYVLQDRPNPQSPVGTYTITVADSNRNPYGQEYQVTITPAR